MRNKICERNVIKRKNKNKKNKIIIKNTGNIIDKVNHYARVNDVENFKKVLELTKNSNLDKETPDFDNEEHYVNKLSSEGYNAFHYACFYGNLDIVKLIYENFLDLNIVNFLGKTGFFLAVERNHIHIVKYLINLCDIRIPDKHGYTVLHKAIENNNIEIVKLLMSTNTEDEIWVDINACGTTIYSQYTPGDIGRKSHTILDYCEKYSEYYKDDEIYKFLFPSNF